MINLIIDNQSVCIPKGKTVLDAALKLNIDIPTLCFLKDFKPTTSCNMCVVKCKNIEKLIPSCSYIAEDGMEIETNTLEVINARKTALNLLLSEHSGDCTAPCQKACPNHLNIPLMIRHIQKQEFKKAYLLIEKCSYNRETDKCKHLCERSCRRGRIDNSVGISDLIKFLKKMNDRNETDNSTQLSNEYDKKRFSSMIRSIKKEELNNFLIDANVEDRVKPLTDSEFSESEAIRESLRCLHCDCGKQDNCKLRNYSETYDAKQTDYFGERSLFKRIIMDDYIFEPGKCIKCGICTQIAEKAGIKYGFTFLKRGFNLEVNFPLNSFDMKELNQIILECDENCPTGAIAKK